MKTARETALEIVRGQMGEEVDESCDCGWVFDIEQAITSAVREARREALEQAAKVAETRSDGIRKYHNDGDSIAVGIRALAREGE